jgi:hypothetical protein
MIFRPIGIIAISFILTACGGSSSSDPVASPLPPKEIPSSPK